MTLFRKSVILKNWDIHTNVRNFCPPKGCSIGYEQSPELKQNLEAIATVVGPRSKINKTLEAMPILSDRYRRLKSLPKWRMIGARKERIQ